MVRWILIADQLIYNPWSILHCLKWSERDPKHAFHPYWIPATNELIEHFYDKLKQSSDHALHR